jgi:hypothetical protein
MKEGDRNGGSERRERKKISEKMDRNEKYKRD